MCGVLGVYYPDMPVILDSILASEFMYHRGHDSSGIAVPGKEVIKKIADVGFFGDWSEKRKDEIHKISGNDAVSLHIRYSTMGSKEKLLKNAQPIVINPNSVNGKDFL